MAVSQIKILRRVKYPGNIDLEFSVRKFLSTSSVGLRGFRISNEKKKNLKYLGREDKPFKKDDSDMPTFQLANDRPELDTRLFMWGNTEFGQLGQQGFLNPKTGQNYVTRMHKPFRASFGERHEIRDVSCGYGFTVFVTKENKGQVFGTGFNQDGQIGTHSREGKLLEILIYPAPIEVPTKEDESIRRVSCGRAHTILLGSKGSVFTLGNNAYGQAGRKIIENEDYFRNGLVNQIQLDHKIVDIIAGQDHSILLSEEGKVLSCGWSADGQTGLGHYNNQDKFQLVQGDIKGEKISKVSCRVDNVLALNEKGEIFGWGNSEYGQFREVTDQQQLNLPTHLPLGIGKIIDIASAGTVCLALNEDGEVFVWGYGILGKGPKLTSSFKPEKIPPTLFGQSEFSPEVRVVRVFAGLDHLAALNSIGDLYIWGKNRSKCLGLGEQGDQFFPLKVAVAGKVKEVSLGVDHTAVLATSWN